MNRTVTGALLVLIAIAGLALIRMERLASAVASQIDRLTLEVHILSERVAPSMKSMSTTYPSTGGPHTTVTDYVPGWTKDQWTARHIAHVAEDQAGDWPLVLPQ